MSSYLLYWYVFIDLSHVMNTETKQVTDENLTKYIYKNINNIFALARCEIKKEINFTFKCEKQLHKHFNAPKIGFALKPSTREEQILFAY